MSLRVVKTAIVILLLPLAAGASAQTVSTINLTSTIRADGIRTTNDGDLVVAGSYSGSRIDRISLPDGQVTTIASGLYGPIDVVSDANGDFFATNWHRGFISKVTAGGAVSPFATVTTGGSGVAFDAEGNLWHTNGSHDQVSIIGPDGAVNLISDLAGLGNPLGVVLGSDGNMYVAGAKSGQIWRMDPSGNATLVATVPSAGVWTIGHIAAGADCLYASGLNSNKIFKVTLDGVVTVLAGTGAAGSLDGPGDQATFNFPNGITISPDGQRLYVTAGGGYINKVRVIELPGPAPVPPVRTGLAITSISPNPFNPATNISFSIADPAHVKLEIFDPRGRRVTTLIDRRMPAGQHQVHWQATGHPSGLYLVRISSGNQQVTGRMMLIG